MPVPTTCIWGHFRDDPQLNRILAYKYLPQPSIADCAFAAKLLLRSPELRPDSGTMAQLALLWLTSMPVSIEWQHGVGWNGPVAVCLLGR